LAKDGGRRRVGVVSSRSSSLVRQVAGEAAELIRHDRLLGGGVVVFEAADGDLLVGAVEWVIEPAIEGFRTSSIHFSWRDSVEFADGTDVASTGRFVDDRPPGLVIDVKLIETLVAIAIIFFPPKQVRR
jgi:hypothetical protein